MEWAEQVALVTGAARGIGRAIALRLARQGAAVCVNFRSNRDAAQTVVQEIQAAGGRVMAVPADVADDAAVESMIDRIDSSFGSVSILVNNAGLSLPGTLDHYDREQMARMRQVNVDGMIHATRLKPALVGAAMTVVPYFWTNPCRVRSSLSPRSTAAMSSARMRSE